MRDVTSMTERTKAWNDARRSLEGLVSALRSELAAQAPRAADELAAAAPRVKAQVSDRITAALPQVVDRLWAAAPFLVRRSRRPAMAAGPLGLLCSFAGGALLMHFCDPERGPACRQVGKQRIASALRFGTVQVERISRLASDRGDPARAGRQEAGPVPSFPAHDETVMTGDRPVASVGPVASISGATTPNQSRPGRRNAGPSAHRAASRKMTA